jgi:hypothetical protein
VKVAVSNGYAVVDGTWKSGDRAEFALPLAPQRVHASPKAAALRGKVALRYRPLIYNVEQHDQDVTQAFASSAAIQAEWREDLLGGVVVLRSRFAGGRPLLAIPNFARMNREPGAELPPPRPGGAPRTEPPPPKSIVWLTEA